MCGNSFNKRLNDTMEHYSMSEAASVDLLIARFLGNTATSDECRQLESWMAENDENLRYFKESKAFWDSALHPNLDVEKSLDAALKQINPKPARRKILPLLQRIAAVLFIPLLLGSMFLLFQTRQHSDSANNWIQTTSAFGAMSQLQLPDGSKVWLNSGSTISYPEKFAAGERIVKLNGEAYFEVSADIKKPFTVQTRHFDVTATGTRFNVMAYKELATNFVTLAEGKVTVSTSRGKSEYPLKPNQNLRFDVLNGHTSMEETDAYKFFAWKDGKIIFRNDRLSDIANRLSYQYNAEIEIAGDIKDLRFRATFENETLSEVLALLKLASPFVYEEQAPQYQDDGTFTKRKIIIKPASNQKQNNR